MSELRVRGAESQIRITLGGELQSTFTAIENFTWTVFSEILQKGYAGETADRYDTIYRGTGAEWSMDPESEDSWKLMQAIADAGARRQAQASVQINVFFVANLPNGKRPRVILPDIKIADPSIGFGSREAYLAQKLNGKTSKFKISGI